MAEVLATVLCKQHDNACPNCGRYMHKLMTKCVCGQKVVWENHYNEFCDFGKVEAESVNKLTKQQQRKGE
jgi:uncharacterized OB-fold protein